jgi:mitochondrial division protein 1
LVNWKSAPHFVKRPSFQKRMLSAASPAELLRTTLSPSDISFRAITYLPDELLYDIPETGDSALSLFQGFKATLPDVGSSTALRKGSKSHSNQRKFASKAGSEPLSDVQRLQRERDSLLRDLEVVTVRKVWPVVDTAYGRVLRHRRSVRLILRYRSSVDLGASF